MWIVSFVGIAFGVFLALLIQRREKRKEDRYFKRMEEAFRNANKRNDQKDYDDKTDFT